MQATSQNLKPQRHEFPSVADAPTAWQLEGDEKQNQSNTWQSASQHSDIMESEMEIDLAAQTANKSFIDKVDFSLNEVGLVFDISVTTWCIYNKGDA